MAGAAVDCGGGVLALLNGQAFGLGERVGRVSAELCILVLEGGYPLDLAMAEGPLPLSRRHRDNRGLPAVTNGHGR